MYAHTYTITHKVMYKLTTEIYKYNITSSCSEKGSSSRVTKLMYTMIIILMVVFHKMFNYNTFKFSTVMSY